MVGIPHPATATASAADRLGPERPTAEAATAIVTTSVMS